MRRAAFLPALATTAALMLSACEGPSNEAPQEPEAGQATAVAVADPCDCFKRDLSEGERRYCRESKRDTRFLESLRKCREGEVGGVSAVNNMPDDGQYTVDINKTFVECRCWRNVQRAPCPSAAAPSPTVKPSPLAPWSSG